MTAIFDPNINIERIAIVGCGGTGSHVARLVGRMLWDRKGQGMSVPQVTFIDPDRVEMKNVGRQMFTAADVGQFKAEVLMRRFNAALGLNTQAQPVSASRANLHNQDIVIGCVDSHHGRNTIFNSLRTDSYARKTNDSVWIDAGNHHDVGQVVLGNALAENVTWVGYETYTRYTHLPFPGVVFPGLLEPEKVEAVSCAEAQAMGDQHLFINDWVAMVVANYVYQLLYRLPVTSFMTWVSVGFVRPVPIEGAELRAKVPTLPKLHDEKNVEVPLPVL